MLRMPTLDPLFTAFLLRAKRATYAAQGDEASVPAALAGSKQLEYAESEFSYRDIYFGMLGFVGQETVHNSGAALWSMAYHGGLLSTAPTEAASSVYAHLRAALLQPNPELPVRGCAELRLADLHYVCVSEGDLAEFWGRESITLCGELVYQLRFGGGLLR